MTTFGGAYIADMQLISKFHKGIDIFNKYTWVVRLKDKKGITITKTLRSENVR